MADDGLIQKALAQIEDFESRANRLKRWVNEADIIEGREPRFGAIGEQPIFEVEGVVKPKGRQFSPGQFFNKPFAGAVKLILQSRYESNGNAPSPASVDEIHEALTQGSFNFETSGTDAQRNSIKISLGKNSTTFVKLPNSELFGLVEWWGKKTKAGRKSSAASSPQQTDMIDDGEEDVEVDPDLNAALAEETPE